MKILLTGANGYVGKRLLPILIESGHEVYALIRNPKTYDIPPLLKEKINIVSGDLLYRKTLPPLPVHIDVAYYLVHSLSTKTKDFTTLEQVMTHNFIYYTKKMQVKQIIYLGGLITKQTSSPHLLSRLNVETTLKKSGIPTTVLRAGIIIGSGSASFEIMRDLVETLPIMIAPKWVHSKCQPISIYDTLDYLVQALGNEKCYDKTFDIGGPDILTYKQMLLILAKTRRLKRYIISVPVLTPRLSSYWLFFVTSTNFTIAKWLVDSLKQDSVCTNSDIQKIIAKTCLSYTQAITKVFSEFEENAIIAHLFPNVPLKYNDYIQTPRHGCFVNVQSFRFGSNFDRLIDAVFSMRKEKNWLSSHWKKLLVDKEKMRILLYNQTQSLGEFWLEFSIQSKNSFFTLNQITTFRPIGILGRAYWYLLYPIHHFTLRKMGQSITKKSI